MRIRSRTILVALVLAAAPAAAQPVTQPAACAVNIVRAPDDVRQVVQAWVAAEPRCSVSLEVRVVPTEGGYYLLARDGHGRLRERIVPDAQSAGVLVASWVADDSLPPPVTHLPPVMPQPAPLPATTPYGSAERPTPPLPAAGPESQGPSTMPAIAAVAPAGTPRVSKWLTAGGMVGLQGDDAGGLRAELDIVTWDRWAFGFGASWSESRMSIYEGSMFSNDKKFVGYLARTGQFGRWHVRTAFGAGLVATQAVADTWGPSGYYQYTAEGAFPTAEASLVVARELGKSWAIAGGPLMSIYGQTYEMSSGQMYGTTSIERRDVELMAYLGLRHRL